MAILTLRIDDILEMDSDGTPERDAAVLGLDQYPIFDAGYRNTLNSLIIENYRMDEIGFEDIGLFRWGMRARMATIMPMYNKMYELDRIEYDPLKEVDMSTIMHGEMAQESTSQSSQEASADVSATSNATSESSGTSEARNFAYPQQQIRSNGEYMTSAAQSDNASESTNDSTDASHTTSTTDDSAESAGTSTSDSTSSQSGRGRSAQDLIVAARDSLVNVNELVIAELSDLFASVWTNGDAPLGHNGPVSFYPFGGYNYGY